jgi:hypothetical protein
VLDQAAEEGRKHARNIKRKCRPCQPRRRQWEARRKLSERQRLALATGLLTGTVCLDRLSWRQVLAVVPGVTVVKIYQMTKGRRVTSKGLWNGSNGGGR